MQSLPMPIRDWSAITFTLLSILYWWFAWDVILLVDNVQHQLKVINTPGWRVIDVNKLGSPCHFLKKRPLLCDDPILSYWYGFTPAVRNAMPWCWSTKTEFPFIRMSGLISICSSSKTKWLFFCLPHCLPDQLHWEVGGIILPEKECCQSCRQDASCHASGIQYACWTLNKTSQRKLMGTSQSRRSWLLWCCYPLVLSQELAWSEQRQDESCTSHSPLPPDLCSWRKYAPGSREIVDHTLPCQSLGWTAFSSESGWWTRLCWMSAQRSGPHKTPVEPHHHLLCPLVLSASTPAAAMHRYAPMTRICWAVWSRWQGNIWWNSASWACNSPSNLAAISWRQDPCNCWAQSWADRRCPQGHCPLALGWYRRNPRIVTSMTESFFLKHTLSIIIVLISDHISFRFFSVKTSTRWSKNRSATKSNCHGMLRPIPELPSTCFSPSSNGLLSPWRL